MSLYVGHLSPHVRIEQLERVFQRFGRCNVQLKDGYGFVVYEVTANAEKALRTLRGRNICGEQISLNWSNKQPRPFQRSARADKFYEPYRRSFRDENNGMGMRGFHDRRDYTRNSNARTRNPGGNHLDDVLDKDTGHVSEDVDIEMDKGVGLKEGVTDEGGNSELNPLENDRWGEPAGDALTNHELESDSKFDRYEPYHGYRKREEKENDQMASPYVSRDRQSSPEKGRKEYSFNEAEKFIDKSRRQQACYNCGLVGHVMRYCPHKNARRERLNKVTSRRNEINFRDTEEGRVKRLMPNLRGRSNSGRDPLAPKHHTWDRKEHQSAKVRRRRSSSRDSSESRGKRRPKPRAVSPKKKRKVEKGRVHRKMMRRSGSSSLSSDASTASSQSHSKSVGSTSGTSSRSRSRSPFRSRSTSSSSRSAPVKLYSKSLSSISKSKSRSESVSSFLRSPSIALDRKQQSPEKANNPMTASPEGNVEHALSPDIRNHLENSEPAVACKVAKEENSSSQFKVDGKSDGCHPRRYADDTPYSAHMVEDKEYNVCIDMQKDVDVTSVNEGGKSDLNGDLSLKSNMQVPVRRGATHSTKISTQEMLVALRHYGLPRPKENEPDISVEHYFGAARLWPWELIYYRRLKKGPISTENYARRLQQNRQFGIVDKYIRSSSGWGEDQHKK